MDGTQLLKGVLDLAVLAVVAEDDGYGYDVVRRLRAAGLDEVGDASVYGTLRRLYSAGALTSYVVPVRRGPAPQVLRPHAARAARRSRRRERRGRRSPPRWTVCSTRQE